MRLIFILLGLLLTSGCATGPIPQNGNQFSALSSTHPFFVKTEKVTIEKPYASVMKAVIPLAKSCFTGTGNSITPSVVVVDGVRTTAKVITLSNSSSQLTIQSADVTMPIKNAPINGSYTFVSNISPAGNGKTNLDIYFLRNWGDYKDKLIEAASGKSSSCRS